MCCLIEKVKDIQYVFCKFFFIDFYSWMIFAIYDDIKISESSFFST